MASSLMMPSHQPALHHTLLRQVGVKYRNIIGPRTLVICPPPRADRPEDLHTQRVIARLRGVSSIF